MSFPFFFQAEDGIRDSSVTGVQTCAFFIQAEDGIRDSSVTGVQTCALPISPHPRPDTPPRSPHPEDRPRPCHAPPSRETPARQSGETRPHSPPAAANPLCSPPQKMACRCCATVAPTPHPTGGFPPACPPPAAAPPPPRS